MAVHFFTSLRNSLRKWRVCIKNNKISIIPKQHLRSVICKCTLASSNANYDALMFCISTSFWVRKNWQSTLSHVNFRCVSGIFIQNKKNA